MRLSRIIMALTVGVAVAAAPTAAGAAQPQPPVYPPPVAALTVGPTTIRLGETFTLRGRGFADGERVAIHVSISGVPAAAPAQGAARRSDGTTVAMANVSYAQAQPQPAPVDFDVTADGDGNFTVTYRPTRPGRYTFTATGASGRTATATGIVLPPRPTGPPHGGGNLPVTGSSVSTPMKLGGGLAGAGVVLLLLSLAWRRRGRFGMGSR
ncbi:hypothetical protein ONA91_11740 [Micromonospora sp. DR5-3]|uniref:hypothetical protein n=1 Tax=unclassified Micromonospora TaxID=2617518 RepID=UPI0011D9633B|nr:MULTISPECIES: hypothetical protein [unclassified Micromonospora]MCW3815126.1 hypothetical protein [Micromonospora sp. DR5-3]TYC22007.1 hypothetical protein FXF52_23030 [Micromonospora sp. MP36]